jgi:hypothetical protein
MEIENWTDTQNCNCSPGKLENSWRKRYCKEIMGNKDFMPKCSVRFCTNDGNDGSHIRIKRGWKTSIIPLCHSHNLTYDKYLKVNKNVKCLNLKGCRCGRSTITNIRSGSRSRKTENFKLTDCCMIL